MKNIYIIIAIIIILAILFYDQIKVSLLNFLVVSRGIVTVNCDFWDISDWILKDSSGINLYKKYKKRYGDFAPVSMFEKDMYLVTNVKYIKTILDKSPDTFGVGKLKEKFFKSFMDQNVGVSHGCPWKKRRSINEEVLGTGKLHDYHKKYLNDTISVLNKYVDKDQIDFEDFSNMGKIMVAKIVFNKNNCPKSIFEVFTKANSLSALLKNNYKITKKTYNNYIKYLKKHIQDPKHFSLVELYKHYDHDETEIIHQIPHFIFPISGLYATTIPRLLVLLGNHPEKLDKVLMDIHNAKYPSQMGYVRKCVLETVRLNNPVVTTFRTLSKDFSFNKKYQFKKGTQFLVLNNPVLREEEYFKNPNQFIPERWDQKMEESYYAISFNQGPQKCPGKDLVIYLCQVFIYYFMTMFRITKDNIYQTIKINKKNIPQMINPCKIIVKKLNNSIVYNSSGTTWSKKS
jgi:cytochrome P450